MIKDKIRGHESTFCPLFVYLKHYFSALSPLGRRASAHT